MFITTHINVFFQLLQHVGELCAYRAYMYSYKLSFYRLGET